MTLEIRANLERVRKEIENNPQEGRKLAKLAIDAIFAGKGTTAWENLMKRYAPVVGSKELDRLCGRDGTFNDTEWGEHCLAYIAGDSTCTSETAKRGGTVRSMLLVDEIAVPPRRMLDILDAEGADLQRINAEVVAAIKAAKESDEQTENLGNTDSSDTDTSNDKS